MWASVLVAGKVSMFFFHKSAAKHSRNYRYTGFNDIRAFMQMSYHDRYFLVGNVAVERLNGWPMGGSLSEPGALIDLQFPIKCLCEDTKVQK